MISDGNGIINTCVFSRLNIALSEEKNGTMKGENRILINPVLIL